MSGLALTSTGGDTLVEGRFGVTPDRGVSAIEELRAVPEVRALTSTGRTLHVLVDGRGMSEAIPRSPGVDPLHRPRRKAVAL
jgi:hypothetical protein